MRTFKRNVFTLIEFLVAISVVAILVGIAIPAFTTTNLRGRQTQALSNLVQIILACKIFATDHNGDFPTNLLDPISLQSSKTPGSYHG